MSNYTRLNRLCSELNLYHTFNRHRAILSNINIDDIDNAVLDYITSQAYCDTEDCNKLYAYEVVEYFKSQIDKECDIMIKSKMKYYFTFNGLIILESDDYETILNMYNKYYDKYGNTYEYNIYTVVKYDAKELHKLKEC